MVKLYDAKNMGFTVAVPSFKLSIYGACFFVVVGPTVFNSLALPTVLEILHFPQADAIL